MQSSQLKRREFMTLLGGAGVRMAADAAGAVAGHGIRQGFSNEPDRRGINIQIRASELLG